MKNIETQIGQLTQAINQSSSKSFPSDMEKNPKYCMAITLSSGRKLDDSKEEKQQVQVEKKNLETEKEMANARMNQEEIYVDDKEKNQMQDKVVPRRVPFPNKPPFYTPPLPFP